MPLYTYAHCGERWEAFHMIAERDTELCPACGEKAARPFLPSKNISTFPAMWYEHIRPDKSVFITSKQQLKEECKKASREFGIEVMAESLL